MKPVGSYMSRVFHLSSRSQVDLRVDYMDAYSRRFVAPYEIAVESTVKQFFFSIPKFAIWMLQLESL
ncbi:MAG: hypothetical protein AVDCRST_MAG96-3493 [uncultured Segetibacter sp.]|uniref:Uncharacterized protein n=1 Tax=uncultured Segetibacter sp. TaxID=481133 RepID=A0A6J4TRG4_9BACT|nr:MAG: hypothetical protein AVDCRST_MAG96-3493 [uncultured Segetibacter sp.]